MILIICIKLLSIAPVVVISLLVLTQISNLKMTKGILIYLLIANVISVIISAKMNLPAYMMEVFELLIYFFLLRLFCPHTIRIELFYSIYTTSFVYFVRMFFNSSIFRNICGDEPYILFFLDILGYFCVIPLQVMIFKYLSINRKFLIISVQNFKGKEKFEKEIEALQNKYIYFFNVICSSFFVCNNVIRLSKMRPSANYQWTMVIYNLLFYFFLYAINGKYKEWEIQRLLKNKDSLISNLEIYTKKVDESYQIVRGFRHDFENILISMRQTIEKGNVVEIKRTYAELLEKSNIKLEQTQEEVSELSNIKVLELKSLIFEKVLKAKVRGIKVKLEISTIISNLLIDKLDIVRILGIMLDNAIEATKEVDQDNRFIRLAIFEDQKTKYYIVENTMLEKELSVKQLMGKDYTTKANHLGYGLANLATIIQHYMNCSYSIRAEDYHFKIVLRLEK